MLDPKPAQKGMPMPYKTKPENLERLSLFIDKGLKARATSFLRRKQEEARKARLPAGYSLTWLIHRALEEFLDRDEKGEIQ